MRHSGAGNQAHLGRIWLYETASGKLVEVARHDPDRFTPGTAVPDQDEESSGIIPAPFLTLSPSRIGNITRAALVLNRHWK
jgi:hypothetical protein